MARRPGELRVLPGLRLTTPNPQEKGGEMSMRSRNMVTLAAMMIGLALPETADVPAKTAQEPTPEPGRHPSPEYNEEAAARYRAERAARKAENFAKRNPKP